MPKTSLSPAMSFIRTHSIGIILFTLTAIGAALRFYNLGLKSFTDDEADYWLWVTQMAAGDPSVPNFVRLNLFLYISSLVVQISQSEAALRFLPALAGTLSLPALYYLVRRFFEAPIALGVAGLLAVSSTAIQMSQQFREYSAFLLFTILCYVYFHKYLTSKKRIDLALLTVLTLAGFFIHVAIAIPLAALALLYLAGVFFFGKYKGKELAIGLGIFSLTILLGMVFLAVYGYSDLTNFGREGFLEAGYYWDGTLASFKQLVFTNTFSLLNWTFEDDVTFLLILVMLMGVFYFPKNQPTRFELPILSAGPWVFTLAFAFLKLYPFVGGHRYDVYLVPGVYLLVAIGLVSFYKWSRPLFFATLVISSAVFLRASWARVTTLGPEEIRPVVQELCAQVSTSDYVVVSSAADAQFEYYWQDCEPGTENVIYDKDPNLEPVIAGESNTIWLVVSHLNDRERRELLNKVASFTQRDIELVYEAPGAFLYLIPASD